MSAPDERGPHAGADDGHEKGAHEHPDLHIDVPAEASAGPSSPPDPQQQPEQQQQQQTTAQDSTQLPPIHRHGHRHGKPSGGGGSHTVRRGQKAVSFAEHHADPHLAVTGTAAGAAASGGPPQPDDRSPLAMLMRSFVYPVSEAHALEDDIRMTLGHEPAGAGDLVVSESFSHAGGAGGSASFAAAAGANNRSTGSLAALGSAAATQASRGSSAGPSSPATAAALLQPHPGGNSTGNLSNVSNLNNNGSGVYERRLPTRSYSGLRRRQGGPASTSSTPLLSRDVSFTPGTAAGTAEAGTAEAGTAAGGNDTGGEEDARAIGAAAEVDGTEMALAGGVAAAEPDTTAQPTPRSGSAPLLGPVVPVLDSAQANHGLPTGEELYHVSEGEPYVFRYNIRVADPPPPALLASDPVLLSALNHSIANGSLRGYSFPNGLSLDSAGGNGDGSVSGGNQEAAAAAGPEAPFAPQAAAGAKEDVDSVFSAREPAGEEEKKKAATDTSSGSGEKAGHSSSGGDKDKDVADEVDVAAADAPPRGGGERDPNAPLFSATETYPLDVAATTAVAVRDQPGGGGTQTYITTGSFRTEPIIMDDVQRERIIVDCFNSLSTETRRLELLEAFYVAHIHPYEGKDSFTADNWDDVMTKTVVPQWFGVEFDQERYCFYVTAFRRRHRVFMFSFLLRCFCIFLFWVLMFCMLPPNWFYPGGLYFDTFSTIIFAGIVGTLGARLIGIPTLIGVIWAGILWNNVPYTGRLTAGITLDIRQFISYFGLSIGIIRAGLSINVIRFKQKFKHFITFSIVPMAAEMVVHGVCAKAIYKYPNYRWAFAEGFVVSAIAPSVIVPIIIAYQRRGYGVRDGPPMMMVCSIAVDTAISIWGVQFLLALEFKTMATATVIVLAPMQVVLGLVGGAVLGFLVFTVTFYVLFMEAERLPGVRSDRRMTLRHSVHVRYLSIGFMILVSFTAFSIGKRFSCTGGAAIGVVTIAGTFNYLCVRGGTRDHLRVKADMAQTLTTVWDYLAMPSLFGLTGASVNVHELFARDFIGQAFGLVFIGIGVRGCVAMLCPLVTRLGLSWPEIIFCGIGWIGKGSVQGSMGGTAQIYAQQELAAATTPEEVAWAQNRVNMAIKMKNTAVLSILVACPICSIFLTRFTSKLLKKGT